MNKEEKNKLISEFIKLKLKGCCEYDWIHGVDRYYNNEKGWNLIDQPYCFYLVKHEDNVLRFKRGLYYRIYDYKKEKFTKRLFLCDISDE